MGGSDQVRQVQSFLSTTVQLRNGLGPVGVERRYGRCYSQWMKFRRMQFLAVTACGPISLLILLLLDDVQVGKKYCKAGDNYFESHLPSFPRM